MTRALLIGIGAVGFGILTRTLLYYGAGPQATDGLALALVALMVVVLAGGMAELWKRLSLVDVRSREWAGWRAEITKNGRPSTPEDLSKLSERLRTLVSARLERTPVIAEVPVFTSYFIGLLVMLGLLGTFLGLFETLAGARDALTASGDVDALRAGLAQPMKGLTRSFGTSAAGVCASVALGLSAVFIRRQEQALHVGIQAFAFSGLAPVSGLERTRMALEALATQNTALPKAAEQLSGVSERLETLEVSFSEAQAQNNRDMVALVADAVQRFQMEMKTAVEESARAARAVVEPLLEGALERGETRQATLFETMESHVETLAQREGERAATQSQHWSHLVREMEALTAASGERQALLGERLGSLAEQLEQVGAGVGDSQRASAEALVGWQRETSEQVAEIMRSTASEFAVAQRESLGEWSDALRQQGDAVSSELASTAELVRESVGTVQAGGAEMTAVAEMFGQSVERQREAADEWLKALGEVDSQLATAVERAGQGAAAHALEDRLGATQELFTHQLEFQRELFEQLRALRGQSIAATHGHENEDEDEGRDEEGDQGLNAAEPAIVDEPEALAEVDPTTTAEAGHV